MKISVNNLGVLKQAEFELGDLTLICGSNNTGKTYATYALFGFLYHWERLLEVEIPDRPIDILSKDGVTRIDLEPYVREADKILEKGCQRYTRTLPRIFASSDKYFKDTNFRIALKLDAESILNSTFERKIRSMKRELFSMTKDEKEKDLVVSLLMDKSKRALPDKAIIKEMISDTIIDFLFSQSFPKPFISSAERTGAAIFRKELDFARNRLLEEMSRSDKNFDPMEFFVQASFGLCIAGRFQC